MTTSTFIPKSSTQSVNWSDPSIWSGGVVPNGASVDVVIPTTTLVSTGQPYRSTVTESETYTIGSLAISDNSLIFNGSFAVAHDLSSTRGNLTVNGALAVVGNLLLNSVTLDMGFPSSGSLSIGSCDNNGQIQRAGNISCSGAFLNEGQIVGIGLSLTTASLTNTGGLVASSGDLTVTVSQGGFTNLSGTTLTGGTYSAFADPAGTNSSGGLYLNV